MTHSRDSEELNEWTPPRPEESPADPPGDGSGGLADLLPVGDDAPSQWGAPAVHEPTPSWSPPDPEASSWAPPDPEPQASSWAAPSPESQPSSWATPAAEPQPSSWTAPGTEPQPPAPPTSEAPRTPPTWSAPAPPAPSVPAPPPAAEQGAPQPPTYAAQPGYPDPGTQPGYVDPSVAQQAAPYAEAPRHAMPSPGPLPQPEDLLVPNRAPSEGSPATWGWRGRLNRASAGLIKPKASTQELAARKAITTIQRSFSRPMTVVVVQPKGGAGKTPTTICLSAAFGAYRGGYVVGWDDNETRGTLAVRVSNPDAQRATVWDLLGDLAAFERFDARVGDLGYYVRSQPDAHFDALVSDDNPANMAQIGEDEFHRLHRVLQRFYRLIVIDTGNNVRSPNWQAAVNAADQIVVVSTYQRDVGYSGSWVLDHLAQTGREELARNAVTVLTAADPTTDKAVREQLLGHFRARTRAVVEIPYDAELAHGGPIRWPELAPQTRTAWTHAGATIIDSLAQHEERSLAARPN